MPFYDPKEFETVEMPGRKRELVAIGSNIQLMLIDREQVSPEGHSHPSEQMMFILEGEARFKIGNEERVIGPWQVVHVPPDVHHSMELLSPHLKYVEVFSPPLEAEAQ